MIGPGRRKPLVSTSPIQNRTYHEQSSPTKASILLRADCSEYVNNLRAKKQNYSTSLGLYTACYEHQLPQKCLKHLNFITLYCEDQHKLLCVNCLYGSTFHKNHSVTPSNSRLPQIKRDNEQNIKSLQDEIKQIKDAQTRINENKRLIQFQGNFIMQQITKQFEEMRRMINQKEKQLKQRAGFQFQKAGAQNETTRRQLSWWKEQIHKMRNNLPRDGNHEDAQIYKHLVLQLMLSERLQTEKLTYLASKDEMQHQFLNQAKELKQFVKNRIYEGSRGYQKKYF